MNKTLKTILLGTLLTAGTVANAKPYNPSNTTPSIQREPVARIQNDINLPINYTENYELVGMRPDIKSSCDNNLNRIYKKGNMSLQGAVHDFFINLIDAYGCNNSENEISVYEDGIEYTQTVNELSTQIDCGFSLDDAYANESVIVESGDNGSTILEDKLLYKQNNKKDSAKFVMYCVSEDGTEGQLMGNATKHNLRWSIDSIYFEAWYKTSNKNEHKMIENIVQYLEKMD